MQPGRSNAFIERSIREVSPASGSTTSGTAATHLLGRGVHPKVVQELLGYSTISLTLDTYSHVAPALHAEVANHMQALFG